MVSETEQGAQETVEQEVVPEETEAVSEETEVVEQEGEPEEVITFKTKAELESHIEKVSSEKVKAESNRIANQSTAPIQSENDKLKAKIAGLERAVVHRSEDTELNKLEAQEREEYSTEDNAKVQSFQETRHKVIELGRTNQSRAAELAETETRLMKGGLRQDAFEKALSLFLPEDKEFLSSIEAFAEKFMKADTQKEMDLIFSMEEAKIKAKAEAPKAKRPVPDKTVASVPGSGESSKKSARDRIEDGLKKMK